MNESKITENQGKITILATEKSDFFRNPGAVGEDGITPESLSNAPFYYTEVTGDFVMKVQVSHEFKDIYDACAVMVMESEEVWAKACFELTDFNTRAVVSVVTNKTSDDANGCNIDGNTVWLQAVRIGQTFGFHYSEDGETFYMMRYFSLPVSETIKVGLISQAPTGSGGERHFEEFSLENITVKNIRVGK
jgi:regulation of enolase protein 1 (concanavalin A-like superfamily)